MPLSWNEIRSRAIAFSREWKTGEMTSRGAEKAEAQTFWNEFFAVFGKNRRHVASFEEPVRNLAGNFSRIDLLWPGTLLAEHKSPGQDLGKAHAQGMAYVRALQDEGRDNAVPRYLVVSDFGRIALYDLDPEQDPNLPLFTRLPPALEFNLQDLHKNVHAFGFLAGYRTYRVKEEDPANIEAAELLADLHDVLEAGGYPKKDLDRFLVRILFCLFAEDTGIFEPNTFQDYLLNRTAEDGGDLGARLEQLFRVLDTDQPDRQKGLDDDLAGLKYVNGQLFADRLDFAEFNRDMRNQLVACTRFNWSRISPAIFGSLFQAVMEPRARRQIGAHYTSERDILKVVRSLFLDDLRAEFDQLKTDRSSRREARLEEFQRKLASIRLLDPACGCGNFLILAYRELRTLEIEALLELHRNKLGQTQTELSLDVAKLSKVEVDQLYGIEISEWPARIAEVAIWLMDHLMNQHLSTAFGQLYERLPLRKSATIVCANALRIDWNSVLPARDCTYVLGNPPFVGKKEQNEEQKADLGLLWDDTKGAGVLDYVTGWYVKAGEYIKGAKIRCALVSTNSITQGEQVGVLWSRLSSNYNLHIQAAHNTFSWVSEARGKAHVHVVIIVFGAYDISDKRLFDYDTPNSSPHVLSVSNLNGYLADAPNVIVRTRTKPLNGAPEINYGSMMIDKDRKAGEETGFIITSEERKLLLTENKALNSYVKKIYGGEEYLNGTERWCLWLVGANPQLIRDSSRLRQRIDGIKRFREHSGREATRKLAATPTLFGEIRQPISRYLLIPKVSSETRKYLPIGFLPPSIIASGSALVVPSAKIYDFGILSSNIHNTWMRQVCGRLESRFQYSNNIVYNNFPWPEDATGAQKAKVEECAQAVLDARQPFLDAGQTLAVLYDPLTCPACC